MRKSFEHLEDFRVVTGNLKSNRGDNFGAFVFGDKIASISMQVNVVACGAEDPESEGWEHVSVSCLYKESLFDNSPKESIPTWKVMCRIKYLFFDPEECVIQFHPPQSQYINNPQSSDNVLHLWKNTLKEFPLPPKNLV